MKGHVWTMAPVVREAFQRRAPAVGVEHAIPLGESDRPPQAAHTHVRISAPAGAREVVVLLHGLGGTPDSPYARAMADAVVATGRASAALWWKGAHDGCADLYHAGLTEDLRVVMGSDALRSFERVWVVGFSLGGHAGLRLAVEGGDARLAGVAAVCPPLDLAAAAGSLDSPARWVYRRHILQSLKAMYARIRARNPTLPPAAGLRSVRTLRQWDAETVVPRFGFPDVETYWATQSVGPMLGRLQVPSLIVAARQDPMIPIGSIVPWLDGANRLLHSCIVEGGHCGFPGARSGSSGVESRVVAWIEGTGAVPGPCGAGGPCAG